ncbi:MAG: hypothetical protein R6T98_04280 [Desulfatiglandales bacterium]
MIEASILILFAPKFKQFGCDVGMEYLRRQGGGKVHGLCTGPLQVKKQIEVKLNIQGGQFWDLATEEKKWLINDSLVKNLSQIYQELGPGAVGRIVVADRRVGRGFVRDGLCRPDSIGRACARASESLPQQYVSGLYAFLDQVLKQTKPDCVFCYAVAGAPALTLAEMCKARKIPFSRLTTSRIHNDYLIDDDPGGRLNSVARSYRKVANRQLDLGHNLQKAKELLQDFRENPLPPGYTQRNQALLRSKKPFNLTFRALISTFYHLAKSVGNPEEKRERIARSWFEACVAWRRAIIGTKPFKAGVPSQRSFIFYPLHVVPEASTMVLSPWHTDQTNVIESLAKSAPGDMLVVVKEHAPMLGKRPHDFYKTISRIPRVVLLGPEHNSLSLVQQASLVAVITGTAAWEAMRLRKPALVIGDSPYLAIGEGVVHEPCLARLAESIPSAIANPPASDQALERYIAACLSESFEMSPSLLWGNYEDHPENERRAAVNNVVDGILKRKREAYRN